jgi:DNA-directed RNA polymerase specialized sigma subunit
MKPKTDRMDAKADSAGATTQLDTHVDTHVDTEPTMGSRDGVVAELIRELTRRERLVLMLRYTEELTVAEIAAVLEVAATEVERMLESISERVRRRVQPSYGRPRARLA